ncbi:hypothetical protein [Halopelagius longus]|uniref:Uncharacterized protein n=1 Tax=Halopelagius longus TaxID=1236180 RepID=A0A1H0ZEN5_9EURY|nr:hypothetical protein [Halopelagius longus]RDI70249.1 hypothetical protein DWB78_00085 [Halopelagius longus]SDQ25824.1 hypothetical protein SAMN05216278_1177 [Halopelagius longus]
MRPRFPSGDGFAISVGVFTVATTYFGLSTFDFAVAPADELPAAVLLGLLAWGAVEQIPNLVDEFVLARGYLAVGALAVLPVLGVVAARLAGRPERVEPFVLPTLGLALVGLLVVGTGSSRRAEQFLSAETEHLALRGTISRRYHLAEMVFSVALGVLVHLAFDDTVTAGTVLGSLVAFAFASGDQSFEATVIDSGLVVSRRGSKGNSLVPWHRVRAVDVDGDTVLVRRAFPRFVTYRFDRSVADDAKEVADVLRRCRRR